MLYGVSSNRKEKKLNLSICELIYKLIKVPQFFVIQLHRDLGDMTLNYW